MTRAALLAILCAGQLALGCVGDGSGDDGTGPCGDAVGESVEGNCPYNCVNHHAYTNEDLSHPEYTL